MNFFLKILMGVFLSSGLFAQTPIQKTVNTVKGQKIYIEAKHANVHISRSTNNQINISGMVKINNGENDDAFQLEVKELGDDIHIISEVENYDKLPHMLMYKKDGKKYYEKIDQDEHKKRNRYSVDENGTHLSYGVIIEIDLNIAVPKHIALDIESTYGKVSLKEFNGPLRIDNTYGAIDAIFASSISPKTDLRSTYNYVDVSLPKTIRTDLKLSSSYGEVYTNLNIEVEKDANGMKAHKKSTIRGVLNGGGPKLDVEATYSNIYLRENEN